eukprot:684256_1
MGSLNSRTLKSIRSPINQRSYINSNFHTSKQTKAIYQWICKEVPLNDDLVYLCVQFIGYFMESTICDVSHCSALYELMRIDHQRRKIVSPLIESLESRVPTYFELLYRVSGNLTNNFLIYFKRYCIGLPNIVMVFQTEFDHVFAFYTHTPITPIKRDAKSISYSAVDPSDAGLYLIKSRFNYKTCPRIIDVKVDTLSFMGNAFQLADANSVFIADFWMRFQGTNNGNRHQCGTYAMPEYNMPQYDMVGNELLGGDRLNPNLICKATFKQIEVFHIL